MRRAGPLDGMLDLDLLGVQTCDRTQRAIPAVIATRLVSGPMGSRRYRYWSGSNWSNDVRR